MFRIRQIASDLLPTDQRTLVEVQTILSSRFSGLSQTEIDALPDRLRDPLLHRLHAILLVADDLHARLKAFALISHAPDVGFCLLDFIASDKRAGGGGVGGALYQRVRETALELSATGLYFECLPDEAEACSDPSFAKENAARLRFYERFGARPIVGTAYETPLAPGGKDLPHLVYDDLGRGQVPQAAELREVVRAILERKYEDLCSPEYNQTVLGSIHDPVRLRAPRYRKETRSVPAKGLDKLSAEDLVLLVVNRKHDIHHVRERGYVESPARVGAILEGLLPTGLFIEQKARSHPVSRIEAVHDPAMVRFLANVCAITPEGKSTYPYVFPLRNRARLPKDLTYAAGYYCLDTFTPLNRNAYPAARGAVDCALTAAEFLLAGHGLAYALVRPPGHHAERALFGGFCYFNNGAIAAHRLSESGKVAILDVDYHHGNGQQDIFYQRDDVLTVSIHGHPKFAYPFFSGFAEEVGEGAGEGYNLNLPLPETINAERFARTLEQALERIADHGASFLIVSLGFDTAKQDPTGTWPLEPSDFGAMGRRIGAMGLPTMVLQEGGYRTLALGRLARGFFTGLVEERPSKRGPVR